MEEWTIFKEKIFKRENLRWRFDNLEESGEKTLEELKGIVMLVKLWECRSRRGGSEGRGWELVAKNLRSRIESCRESKDLIMRE